MPAERTQRWHRTAEDRQQPCRYAYGTFLTIRIRRLTDVPTDVRAEALGGRQRVYLSTEQLNDRMSLNAGIVLLRTRQQPCRFAYGYPDPAAGTVLPPEPIRLRADMPVEHDPVDKNPC